MYSFLKACFGGVVVLCSAIPLARLPMQQPSCLHSILWQDQYGWTSLRWATYTKHPETAKVLVDAGADVNSQDQTLKI